MQIVATGDRTTAFSPAHLGAAGPSAASRRTTMTLGQMNAYNLFDDRDDPLTGDKVLTSDQYQTRLAKVAVAIRDALKGADVIGLQEVENEVVLRDLVARPEIAELGYSYIISPLNDPRGIRVAHLYRADRVELVDKPGPRSVNPVPKQGLPDRGQGHLNRTLLYARTPLLATYRIRGAAQAEDGANELTVVVNHFKSRLGGAEYDPRRELQGAYLGGVVDGLRRDAPNRGVAVIGDLNQFVGDDGFDRLVRDAKGKRRLVDTADSLPTDQRYSYVHDGNKNLLDHILVTPDLAPAVTKFQIARIGITTTKRAKAAEHDPTTKLGASDHDVLLATINLAKRAAS